jgi:hypothetical protein
VLPAAAHLQVVLPGATLVGGTAAALYAAHRISYVAGHGLPGLRERFDELLAQLESIAGGRTARVRRPVVIAKYSATRDYLDFVALAERMGADGVFADLANLDRLYPQPGGESAFKQLQVQPARPRPYDLDETNLAESRRLDAKWHDWQRVSERCAAIAADILCRPGRAGAARRPIVGLRGPQGSIPWPRLWPSIRSLGRRRASRSRSIE